MTVALLVSCAAERDVLEYRNVVVDDTRAIGRVLGSVSLGLGVDRALD